MGLVEMLGVTLTRPWYLLVCIMAKSVVDWVELGCSIHWFV